MQECTKHPIKTHFITASDKLDDIVSKYVLPKAKKGDIVVLSEKIVSIIQDRVVAKKDIKLGFWAKFLSGFAKKTPTGFSVGNPYKMQLAINLAGLPRILLASFLGGMGKLIGLPGTFYKVAGHDINRIDGFYGEAFREYAEIGILACENADKVCLNLKKKFGFDFVIADVNDLGLNIIGTTYLDKKFLREVLKDNPATQSEAQTPIVIIRR